LHDIILMTSFNNVTTTC